MVKNLPAVQETQVQSLGQKDPLGRKGQPTPVFLPEKVKVNVAQSCPTLRLHGLFSPWNSPSLGLNSCLGVTEQQANTHRWKSADFRAYIISWLGWWAFNEERRVFHGPESTSSAVKWVQVHGLENCIFPVFKCSHESFSLQFKGEIKRDSKCLFFILDVGQMPNFHYFLTSWRVSGFLLLPKWSKHTAWYFEVWVKAKLNGPCLSDQLRHCLHL